MPCTDERRAHEHAALIREFFLAKLALNPAQAAFVVFEPRRDIAAFLRSTIQS
jgi:hypothetical protein